MTENKVGKFVRHGLILFMIISICGLTITVNSVFTSSKAMHSSGKISANGDITVLDASNQIVSTLDWGTLEPNTKVIKTFTVENIGNVDQYLTCTTNSWVPAGWDAYFTFTPIFESDVIGVGEWTTLTLELTLIDTSNLGDIVDFSFDIMVSGTSQSS